MIMIDNGASVHVCHLSQKETRPSLTAFGAEMKQYGEVGKVTLDYRVLDVRRPIWPLGAMVDSSCDVHFTKDRCCISKDDGKELDMIRGGGVFFVVARPTKPSSRDKHTGTQSDRGQTYKAVVERQAHWNSIR